LHLGLAIAMEGSVTVLGMGAVARQDASVTLEGATNLASSAIINGHFTRLAWALELYYCRDCTLQMEG